jgi:hypothetical protein
MAWGLAAAMAALLVGGIGVILTHGISIGETRVQLIQTEYWYWGIFDHSVYSGPGVKRATRRTSLGIVALDVTRFHLPPR